jgi:hypothetical protein
VITVQPPCGTAISIGSGAQYLQRLTRLDAALVRVHIRCVFVRIITESEICCIYEAVLRTIKVVTCNLSRASNFIA